MGDIRREPSQEFWRPAPGIANPFPPRGPQLRDATSCTQCGTPYAIGARFCHFCGQGREGARQKQSPVKLDIALMRTRFGLSTASLLLVLMAAVFMLAAVMTGLSHTSANMAEWGAVQSLRVEWLLATVAALLGAMVFKTRP